LLNYYQILEVSESAHQDEIRAAFKRLAVIFHPDKNPDDLQMEEKFKEINEAYQVLSNPYRKARYDLMRNFGANTHIPESYPAAHPPYVYTRRQAEPTTNHIENWKATLYAFLFTFAVAFVVMSFIGIKKYFEFIKEEERMARRKETFQKAKTLYATGYLDSTYFFLNKLGAFDQDKENEMQEFKNQLIQETKYLGRTHFANGRYSEAIYYLEILDKHTVIKELTLKESLAQAYKNTDQTYKSIYTFTQLLMHGFNKTYVYVQLAEIHRDDLEDYNKALFFFEKANDSAKEHFEAVYGKAYHVILTGRVLPEMYFRLYTGLADIYLKLDQPQQAISVTEWNKQIWHNRQDNFLIAAEGYKRLGNEIMAREELNRFYRTQ
jgi:hypothetical protein